MKPLYSTILASFGGILAAFGFAYAPVGLFLPTGGLLFVLGLSASIGAVAFQEERKGVRFLFGLLGTLALVATFGAATYWFHALDAYAISGLLFVLPWIVLAVSPIIARLRIFKVPQLAPTERSKPLEGVGAALTVAVAGFDFAALRSLVQAATSEAIRSPWEVVHPIFFLWIFLGSLAVIALAWRSRTHHIALLAAAFHLFTVLSPALLVYAVGYGFDPFIHVATESAIAAQGQIEPKPPYYLGQYAIVVVIARLFRLPVEALDQALLPVLSAIMLPLAAVYLLRRAYKLERYLSVLGALGVFLLPLGGFAVTTPQGLGNLFAFVATMLGVAWLHDHRPTLPYVLLLAGAALVCHPLSGAPAVLAVLFLMFFKLRESDGAPIMAGKALLFAALVAASVVLVPLLFAANASRSGSGSAIDAARLAAALPTSLAAFGDRLPGLESRFDALIDFAELAASNRVWIVLGLAAIGAWVLGRGKGYRRTVWASLALAAGLGASVFILRHGAVFAGVAAYEQRNYGDRLADVALLILSPLTFAGVAWWWRHLRTSEGAVRAFHVVLMAGLTAAFAYASFPRNDAFAVSRGYSVSAHDIAAVHRVHEASRGADYLVLANQSVSAAALREFGFRRYFGDQYFYPIPTGGPLYQRYLEMVYGGAKRETALEAMRTYGVKKAYFIINDYWTGFETLVAAATKTADASYEVGGGKLYVFEYRIE